MRLHLRLAVLACIAASSAIAALAACDSSSSSSSSSGSNAPDAQQPVPIPTTTPSDSSVPPMEDAGSDSAPADSGDAGLFGTGKGLRVKFVGAEHSFGASDESSLWDAFKADTTLMPTRVVNPATFDAAFLADADVVVLDAQQRGYNATEATALYDWVRAGHGVIALSGFGDNTSVNALLQPFGISVNGSGLGGSNSYSTILQGSPVAVGVSSLLIYGGGGVTAAGGTPFAEFNGTVVGVATTHDKGRVVTYGDDWILLDAEVDRIDDGGVKPAQRFWHNALLWAGNRL